MSPELQKRHVASWHACLTRARSEKKAAERLSSKGITTYLPLIPRERQWKDRKKVVEWPIFPSYVFCRVAREDLTGVLTTPGIASVVRHQGAPAVIRDEEIESVRRLVEGLTEIGLEPESASLSEYRDGQPVRVLEGPFKGVRGRVLELRGRRRLLVGVTGIGQALEVDLSAASLEPVDPS